MSTLYYNNICYNATTISANTYRDFGTFYAIDKLPGTVCVLASYSDTITFAFSAQKTCYAAFVVNSNFQGEEVYFEDQSGAQSYAMNTAGDISFVVIPAGVTAPGFRLRTNNFSYLPYFGQVFFAGAAAFNLGIRRVGSEMRGRFKYRSNETDNGAIIANTLGRTGETTLVTPGTGYVDAGALANAAENIYCMLDYTGQNPGLAEFGLFSETVLTELLPMSANGGKVSGGYRFRVQPYKSASLFFTPAGE